MSSQYNVSIRHNVQTPYYRAERYNEVLLYIINLAWSEAEKFSVTSGFSWPLAGVLAPWPALPELSATLAGLYALVLYTKAIGLVDLIAAFRTVRRNRP